MLCSDNKAKEQDMSGLRVSNYTSTLPQAPKRVAIVKILVTALSVQKEIIAVFDLWSSNAVSVGSC